MGNLRPAAAAELAVFGFAVKTTSIAGLRTCRVNAPVTRDHHHVILGTVSTVSTI